MSNQFLQCALEQISRLLGQLNRNPSSVSLGSFDRAYWHYRTNDISCCRYQEAVYTLALLYCYPFAGNDYYLDAQVLKWIQASLRFTVSIQRSNGSFDEWYLNEDSYVGTAFLTVSLGQTLLLLKSKGVQIIEEEIVCKTIERAAGFLSKKEENTVMNQVSGAIFALSLAARLCNRDDFSNKAERVLGQFLDQQSKEGWWSEYGGPDIGYLSLTISYLDKFQRLTGSNKARAAITKAKSFIEFFIHPDQTAGGEYMSRNTEYLIPSPFLPYLGVVQPRHLDDRYLCYILYNWIETGLNIEPQPIFHNNGEQYFSESGLLRVVNDQYFLISNGRKGGAFRLYSKGLVYYDSGLEIAQSRGKHLSTGILDSENNVWFEEGRLRVTGQAKPIKEPLLSTGTAILFKLWQLLFGRLLPVKQILKKFLRQQMISYRHGSEISFERKIEHTSRLVKIVDAIRGVKKEAVAFGVKASYSAVPSSKYAARPEISLTHLSPEVEIREVDGIVIITRTFSF